MIQSASPTERKRIRCAIYTRKSTEENLEMEFNSLVAQREACESYIASQKSEGWTALAARYDDGGFTGGNIDRPALKQFMADIEAGNVNCVVVYKVDRLSRSLMDFAKLIAAFEQHQVAFVSVTQRFDTTTSMGRLTLNVLLSFAQFEREVIGERIRDKLAASKMKGKYVGGRPLLGYDVDKQAMRMVVNPDEARLVKHIFERFLRIGSCMKVAQELNAKGLRMKAWTSRKGKLIGGGQWNKAYVHNVLRNRRYLGLTIHKGQTYPGEHEAIIDQRTWDRAQAILSTNRGHRRMQTRRKTIAMLKGLVRCGHCGGAMHDTWTAGKGRSAKKYRYYVCNRGTKIGMGSCPVKSVPAGEIENAVFQYLQSVFRSPDVTAKTVRAMQEQALQQQEELRGQREPLENRLAELRKTIRTLVQAGGKEGGALADELRRLNDEYSAAEQRLAEVDSQIAAGDDLPGQDEVIEALRNMDLLWADLFPAEQHRIARLLVDQVVLNPDGLTIRLRANGLRDLVAEVNAGSIDVEERKVNI
jgi:site-specific DNA recombinase